MTTLVQRIIVAVVIVAVLGLAAIGYVASVAVYGWKAAQRAGNEAAAIQNLKTIAAVEIQYYNTHNRTFGTVDELINEKMLTSKFSGRPPVADGYVFSLSLTAKTSGKPGSYALNADPQGGGRHFYVDSTSTDIHFNSDQPASASDPDSN